MNDLKLVDTLMTSADLTMSSLEIAGLLGEQHKHVLIDIDKMFNDLGINSDISVTTRVDRQGDIQRVFNLSKVECVILTLYYGIKMVPEMLARWTQLEATVK